MVELDPAARHPGMVAALDLSGASSASKSPALAIFGSPLKTAPAMINACARVRLSASPRATSRLVGAAYHDDLPRAFRRVRSGLPRPRPGILADAAGRPWSLVRSAIGQARPKSIGKWSDPMSGKRSMLSRRKCGVTKIWSSGQASNGWPPLKVGWPAPDARVAHSRDLPEQPRAVRPGDVVQSPMTIGAASARTLRPTCDQLGVALAAVVGRTGRLGMDAVEDHLLSARRRQPRLPRARRAASDD